MKKAKTELAEKSNDFKRRGSGMPDKLDKCYYWHIITLALMKNNLRILGGKRKWAKIQRKILMYLQIK